MGIQCSDNFEPNTSSKTNRGSVWIKALTSYQIVGKQTIFKTYPISIGLKYVEHDVIENEFIKESHDLSNGVNNIFYSMFLKYNV